ncbi:MAG: helix-turn-helix transcriptional regulator [Ktedonobacteraceae bacterium]
MAEPRRAHAARKEPLYPNSIGYCIKKYGYTRTELAEEIGIDRKTLYFYCAGQLATPKYTLEKIARTLRCSVVELGAVPEGQSKQESVEQSALQSTAQGMLRAIQNLEQEGIDMNSSRRFFLQMLGAIGVTLVAVPKEALHSAFDDRQNQITDISATTIENLASMIQHCRSLQRAGFATQDSLRSLVDLIQNALENTMNNKYRRELWRIQTQSQLLARHSITRKRELGRARTWNELSIASAQYSGDAFLLGATLGHLGHLYVTWQHDSVLARQLISQAQEYTKGHPISGWFAMVLATIAATEDNKNECEAAIAQATEVVHGLPHTSEWADMYYTDFNVVGVDAFAGNCLIKVGEPEKGLERLAAIDMGILSDNRHASAFYDIACAHAMLGEFEVTQAHAFRAIDKALVTDRLYIIPRLITLARRMQKKDPQEPHAAAIVDYAHAALHEYSKGELE